MCLFTASAEARKIIQSEPATVPTISANSSTKESNGNSNVDDLGANNSTVPEAPDVSSLKVNDEASSSTDAAAGAVCPPSPPVQASTSGDSLKESSSSKKPPSTLKSFFSLKGSTKSRDASSESVDGKSPSSNTNIQPNGEPAWASILRKFWTADQTFCDNRFKLIPSIVEANWSIKMAVGSVPALTGKKLTQRYFRGPGYMEVDIDISSSTVANHILGMV